MSAHPFPQAANGHRRWDVVIVGGGPAGLDAALVLGRCRRNVLLFDDGRPRNHASHAVHGFLGHDGISPKRLRELARQQLARYPSVVIKEQRVVDAAVIDAGFELTDAGGRRFRARKLLLAAGVVDTLPEISGCDALYGKSVFLCPYCDGWEMRDQALAAYGRGDDKGGGLALELTLWSRDVVLCCDGPGGLSEAMRARLTSKGIAVREEKIVRLAQRGDKRIAEPYRAPFDIEFESGPALHRAALFFNTSRRQSSDLAARLGCRSWDIAGCTVNRPTQSTDVPGLYVAGDASRDVLQAVVAAAEGAQAAIAINSALMHEDLAP